ncbi:transposase, partial [Shigella sonnei]
TSKTPSYTKSVSWQHHLRARGKFTWRVFLFAA